MAAVAPDTRDEPLEISVVPPAGAPPPRPAGSASASGSGSEASLEPRDPPVAAPTAHLRDFLYSRWALFWGLVAIFVVFVLAAGFSNSESTGEGCENDLGAATVGLLWVGVVLYMLLMAAVVFGGGICGLKSKEELLEQRIKEAKMEQAQIETRQRLRDRDRDVEELQAKLDDLEEREAMASERVEAAEAAAAAKESQISAHKQTIEAQQHEIGKARDEINDLREQILNLERSTDGVPVAELRMTLERTELENNVLQDKIDKLRLSQSTVEQKDPLDVQELKKELGSKDALVQELEGKLREMQKERDAAMETVESKMIDL